MLEDYGILDIAHGLEKIGIAFHDYNLGTDGSNTGNLMLRGKKVVVIDLGNSKVTGAGSIEQIDEAADFWKANAQMAWRARLMKSIR